MNEKEILEYLLPIWEEDEDRLLIEVEILKEQINLGKLSRYYYRGYKHLILRIAEIRGENICNFIYSD